MREELDEVRGSIRASSDETRNAITAQMAQFRRDMLRGFRQAQQLQERALEAGDPTYERPKRAHAKDIRRSWPDNGERPGDAASQPATQARAFAASPHLCAPLDLGNARRTACQGLKIVAKLAANPLTAVTLLAKFLL